MRRVPLSARRSSRGSDWIDFWLIASCSVAYTSGMVAANFEWLAWWFMVLLAMVFVPYYLTTGVSTMPEFMLRRFGKATFVFLSWYTLFTTRDSCTRHWLYAPCPGSRRRCRRC